MCHGLKSSKFQFQAVCRLLRLNVSCSRPKSKRVTQYVACGIFCGKSPGFANQPWWCYSYKGSICPWTYQGPAPTRPRHAAAVVPAPSHRHQAARAAWPRNTAESVMGLREMAAWHIFTPQVDQGGWKEYHNCLLELEKQKRRKVWIK